MKMEEVTAVPANAGGTLRYVSRVLFFFSQLKNDLVGIFRVPRADFTAATVRSSAFVTPTPPNQLRRLDPVQRRSDPAGLEVAKTRRKGSPGRPCGPGGEGYHAPVAQIWLLVQKDTVARKVSVMYRKRENPIQPSWTALGRIHLLALHRARSFPLLEQSSRGLSLRVDGRR